MGVEGVQVVGELVGAIAEAGHADYGVLGDYALLVEGMAASEMGGSLFSDQWEAASLAVG